MEVQSDFEDVENSVFDYFFGDTFASKPLSSAKNYRRGMLLIFKPLSELRAIRQ